MKKFLKKLCTTLSFLSLCMIVFIVVGMFLFQENKISFPSFSEIMLAITAVVVLAVVMAGAISIFDD